MEVTDTMIDHMTNPMTAPMVDIMTERVVLVRPHKLWHNTHHYNQPYDTHHDDQPHDRTHDQPQDWTLQDFTQVWRNVVPTLLKSLIRTVWA